MYCIVDDLLKKIPQAVLVKLTDDAGTGAIDQTKVDDAMIDAANEIDSYCRSRYPVPFNPVPGIIKKLALDIALYNLFSRRGFEEGSPDKIIADRYKAAIELLEKIARGLVSLGDSGNAPPPPQGVDISNPPRRFSRPKLEGF
ncbi:MAG: DUF1320 domain-containing protein [Firmicutes bacterium]|nr:DUF1320 domain-containing protein [Bacillota bacterium]